jgi:predicted nuclease with TOPRIM domain
MASMDILNQFEEKIDGLLERIRTVEAENARLQQELESERTQKQDVLHRIDNLLKKIQEAAM